MDAELRARRARALRLTPDRALADLDEAADWVIERGMVAITEHGALPSLFVACHEPPYRPGARGFGSWPATRYGWPVELAATPGIHALRILAGRRLLVSDAVAAAVDPLARRELESAAGSPLLRHLAAAGPSLVEELREELGMDAPTLRRLRGPLERRAALVSRSAVLPGASGGHRHTSELWRWDQVFPRPPTGGGGLDELVVAAVRACVLAPEAEVGRWFSWPVAAEVVDGLVSARRLQRVPGPKPALTAA